MDNNFSKKINEIDKSTLEAARRGDTKAVLQGLNDTDRQKVQEMLADEDKLKKLLSSDAAKNLMKILGGGKGNG